MDFGSDWRIREHKLGNSIESTKNSLWLTVSHSRKKREFFKNGLRPGVSASEFTDSICKPTERALYPEIQTKIGIQRSNARRFYSSILELRRPSGTGISVGGQSESC